MEEQITTLFVLCDDLLKTLGHRDDPQRHMSTAEVMTTAVVAGLYFGANYERSRAFLKAFGFIPDMLSKSRFCRCLQAVPEVYWRWLLSALWHAQQAVQPAQYLAADSFPLPVCHNIRIKHCRIYPKQTLFRGYCASKRQYVYGLRLHLLLADNGQPVDFCLAPASEHDCAVFKRFGLEEVPDGTEVYLDAAYTFYDYEDLVQEATSIQLIPQRKKNAKRRFSLWMEGLQGPRRQIIETAGSLIHQLLPAHLHAVTPEGFERKCGLLVIALGFLNFCK